MRPVAAFGRRPLVTLLAFTLGATLIAEVGLRLSGIMSFPLFRIDPAAGYVQKPSQSGRYLNRNDWAYDDRGLGVAAPFRPTGVLLAGDSVVNGGNPLRQADKIGPQLSATIHQPVWPLAAGGWSLENELQVIRENPDFLRVPTIVFVSNSGDFGEENGWTSDVNYPVRQPVSAIVYVARKFIFKPHDSVESALTSPGAGMWRQDLADFLASYHGRLIWVLYPKKSEIGKRSGKYNDLLAALHGRAEIIDLTQHWRGDIYRDADMHPSPLGDRAIANAIASRIESAPKQH